MRDTAVDVRADLEAATLAGIVKMSASSRPIFYLAFRPSRKGRMVVVDVQMLEI